MLHSNVAAIPVDGRTDTTRYTAPAKRKVCAVARVNGKPGSWAKSRAERQFDRLILSMSLIMLVCGVGLGFFIAKG